MRTNGYSKSPSNCQDNLDNTDQINIQKWKQRKLCKCSYLQILHCSVVLVTSSIFQSQRPTFQVKKALFLEMLLQKRIDGRRALLLYQEFCFKLYNDVYQMPTFQGPNCSRSTFSQNVLVVLTMNVLILFSKLQSFHKNLQMICDFSDNKYQW